MKNRAVWGELRLRNEQKRTDWRGRHRSTLVNLILSVRKTTACIAKVRHGALVGSKHAKRSRKQRREANHMDARNE